MLVNENKKLDLNLIALKFSLTSLMRKLAYSMGEGTFDHRMFDHDS